MRNTLLILSLLFFTSFPALAQIELQLRASHTGQPLDSVTIRNQQTGEVEYTDKQGQALLPWSTPIEIQLFKPSYQSRTLRLNQDQESYQFELEPLNVQLREVIVQAFEQNRRLEQVPGSISHLSEEEIGRFDQSSLLPSVNVLPGVRLEERSPGSYRVSIRGSSLRAPFGVRNVKIYWNGMPLTEPGGDTQLNFLDLINIDQLEVIKGPASSLYGAGTGGAMLLETKPQEENQEAGYLAGSYGLQRAYAKMQVESEQSSYGIRLAHQQTDGYREHSALERQVAQLSTRHKLGQKRELQTHLLYSKLSYQIPGGLNPQQFSENPRQARARSAEKNASINYDVLISSISHDWEYENLQNQTTLYTYLHYFDHPFITDYKKENTLAGGGRTVFQYHFQLGEINSTLTAGGEYQLQHRSALNFDNVAGQPDSLNFSDEITSGQYLIFSQANLELPAGWLLTGGLSYNRLRYTLNRLFDRSGEALGTARARFDPDLAARFGAVKTFSPALNLHASLSQGFSPPGLREFRTNEGSINTNLQPERGTNYEAGIRGKLLNQRLFYDLTAYHFRLDQTIVSYQDVSGVVLFRNAGATRQNGLELWADYLLYKGRNGFLRELRYRQGYNFTHSQYQEYIQGGQNYQGNKIPGLAPHTLTSSLSLHTWPGFRLQADWQFVDDIPLNDANTVYAESYHLLRAKLSYILSLKNFEGEIFAGSDNLLNEVYSLGNDLNPEYGERYFQPAAARSIFAGMRIEL